MSLFTQYRESWVPGLLRRQPTFEGGLREWLVARDWSPEAGMSKRRITLAVHSTEAFVDACVYDAIKFANVAFESATSKEVPSTSQQACAWQFIRYYYAAYFAGNALMRLCGHACTNLTAVECQQINEQAFLYSVGGFTDKDKIVPGLFYVQFDVAKTQQVNLRAASGRNGVHAQFWGGFSEFLSALSHDIKIGKAPLSDRSAAISEIDLLTAELKRMGNQQGSRLSELRNAVNYRFEHGLWFPYENCDVERTSLIDAFKREATGETTIVTMGKATQEIVRATRICAFLLAWLYDSMKVIENSSKGSKKKAIADGVLTFATRF